MGQTASKDQLQQCLQALLHYNISPDEYEFWDSIWRKPSSSMEEVFALLSPEEVRYLRDKRFDNFATLYTQAVVRLCNDVASPPNDDFNKALTCARVLTRLIPIMLEQGDLSYEPSVNVEQLCWSTGEETEENNEKDANVPETSDTNSSQPGEKSNGHDVQVEKENKDNHFESNEEQETNIQDDEMVPDVSVQTKSPEHEEQACADDPATKDKIDATQALEKGADIAEGSAASSTSESQESVPGIKQDTEVKCEQTTQAADDNHGDYDLRVEEHIIQSIVEGQSSGIVGGRSSPVSDTSDDNAYVIVSSEGESQLVSVDSSESVVEVSVASNAVCGEIHEDAMASLKESSKEVNNLVYADESTGQVLDEVELSRLDDVERARLDVSVLNAGKSETVAKVETTAENPDHVDEVSNESTPPLVDSDKASDVRVELRAVESEDASSDSTETDEEIGKTTKVSEDGDISSNQTVETSAEPEQGVVESSQTNDDRDAQVDESREIVQKPVSRRTLAALTVRAAMHMLFMPQFTYRIYDKPSLRKSRDFDNADDLLYQEKLREKAGYRVRKVKEGLSLDPSPTLFVWSPGAGVTVCVDEFRVSQKYDKNRIEFLRMLLASCCDPLYCPSDEYNPLASRWLLIATAADAPKAVCLFYSLLNTILSFDPTAIDDLRHPNHTKLVNLSAQVLCVLLDYGVAGSPEPVIDDTGAPCVEMENTTKPGFNIFRTILARIDSAYDLDFIFGGFMRHFQRLYEAQTGIIRGKKLQSFRELLVLFWRFLQENPYFLKHLMSKRDIHELLVPLCYLMNKSRSDPAHIRLVHVCTFILLKLSGERQFCVSLNKPFDKKFAADFPSFRGCHADLLALTLHKLIVSGATNLSALYSGFLTIIANISPYWKSMSYVTAKSLVNLFQVFSSDQYLYSGEAAYKRVHLLFEIFDNILQYQSHGNDYLLLEIIRYKTNFEELASLTLEQAQAEMNILEQSNCALGATSALGTTSALSQSTTKDEDNDVPQVARRFELTEEWLDELKDHRGLETILRVLKHFVPLVEDLKSRGISGEGEILAILNETTMVGLLPVPHRLEIRKYEPNEFTWLWLTSFLWGSIFAQNQSFQLFDATYIELFHFESLEDDDDEEDGDDDDEE